MVLIFAPVQILAKLQRLFVLPPQRTESVVAPAEGGACCRQRNSVVRPDSHVDNRLAAQRAARAELRRGARAAGGLVGVGLSQSVETRDGAQHIMHMRT